MNSETYNKLCKNAISQWAFQFLQDKKTQSKSVQHIQFRDFKMASYLSENQCNLTTKERQLICQCRFNDSDLRGNKNGNMKKHIVFHMKTKHKLSRQSIFYSVKF